MALFPQPKVFVNTTNDYNTKKAQVHKNKINYEHLNKIIMNTTDFVNK